MYEYIRYRMVKLLIIALLVAGMSYIPATVSCAAEGKTESKTVQSIPPVPAFNPVMINIQGAIDNNFNGQGWIDDIRDNVIIINDNGHEFSDSGVVSGFSVGQYVGFKLDDSGQVTELEPLTPPHGSRGH